MNEQVLAEFQDYVRGRTQLRVRLFGEVGHVVVGWMEINQVPYYSSWPVLRWHTAAGNAKLIQSLLAVLGSITANSESRTVNIDDKFQMGLLWISASNRSNTHISEASFLVEPSSVRRVPQVAAAPAVCRCDIWKGCTCGVFQREMANK
jgi:hypothetical protein